MKRISVDTTVWEKPADLHAAMKEAFSFPEYYGGNLDALHDELTSLTEPVELLLTGTAGQLGSYGHIFLRVLNDACEENPCLTVLYL